MLSRKQCNSCNLAWTLASDNVINNDVNGFSGARSKNHLGPAGSKQISDYFSCTFHDGSCTLTKDMIDTTCITIVRSHYRSDEFHDSGINGSGCMIVHVNRLLHSVSLALL